VGSMLSILNTLILLIALICTLDSNSAYAADTPYIPVGAAKTRKTVIAMPLVRPSGNLASGLGKTIRETVISDLSFMDLFTFLDSSAFVENSTNAGITPGSFKMTDWSSIGADMLAKAELTVDIKRNLSLDARLYDTKTGKELLNRRYLGALEDVRTLGHNYANDIVQTLTGMPGIFLTKIAMSCDLNGKKEVYTMNFDGSAVKQVTFHRSIAFAPAWSPDSKRLTYSLFTRHRNIKNIDLYEFDFTTTTVRLLSNRQGINSGAAYSPDGKHIAVTMSFGGNPEIYSLNVGNRMVRQMTKSLGFDVDPSWSPDGQNLAFVSSRTGMPMVFSMKADGTEVQRLTYAGRYNASPTWSPRNNKIGFAGWIDRSFDIFIMNPDGTHIERLTKNQGNNEDPHFSPDGNFITFSSNRAGQKNIYVMNIDGTFVKRLTYGLGNCVAPKWSLPPKLDQSYGQE
jgi:TolB protein